MNTLEQASTLLLRDVNPYHHRIVTNLNSILPVPQVLQVHLLRVLTFTQPKMSIMPSKVHLTSVLNVSGMTHQKTALRGQVSEGKVIV
jgi:hypothetical protein